MKLKVLLINPTYPPVKCGMADYCRKLALFFNETLPVQMNVLTGTAGKKPLVYTDGSVKIYSVMTQWNIAELKILGQVIHREKPHIIHIQYHENDFPSTWLVNVLPVMIRYMRRIYPKTRVVCSMAGFEFTGDLNFMQKLMVRFSDCAIVTTDEDMQRIRHLKKTFCIYDGPNIIAPADYKITYSENMQSLNLLFFGFINPEKGLHLLFEAMKLLKEKKLPVHLRIVGELHDEIADNSKVRDYHRKLKIMIDRLGIKDSVEFTGYVEESRLAAYFADADAAVFPFIEGIMGKRSSFWSVLHHGVPGITTWGKYVPENVKNLANVMLAEPTAESLARNIEKLHYDRNLLKRIGESGRILVNEHFGWKNITESLLAVYRNTLFGK